MGGEEGGRERGGREGERNRVYLHPYWSETALQWLPVTPLAILQPGRYLLVTMDTGSP